MKILLILILAFNTSFAKITPLKQETIRKLERYKIFSSNCSKIQQNLVEVHLNYYGFDGKIKTDGLIIAHKAISQAVENIFRELLEVKFPIHGIDPFKGGTLTQDGFTPDDNYNYAGSFYCRSIQSGSTPSVHSLGMAIDVNPLYNPYIEILKETKSVGKIIPKDGVFHINRGIERKGKETRNGIITKQIVDIFAKHGFNIWGGDWDFPIDYHHFQLSNKFAFLLSSLKEEDAEVLFQMHINFYNKHQAEILNEFFKAFKTEDVNILIKEYNKNPEAFLYKANLNIT